MQFSRNETGGSSKELLIYVNYAVDHIVACVEYVEENISLVLVTLLLYFILCCSLYYICSHGRMQYKSKHDIKTKRRILFVISHPDDECMFFGPAILNLTQCPDKNVFLLCLSYG